MSVGPMGSLFFSAAGTPLAQTTGSDVARARADAVAQQRGKEAEIHTEDAAGIGKTDGDDNQTNERDADGRTPWFIGRRADDEAEDSGESESPLAEEESQGLDLSTGDSAAGAAVIDAEAAGGQLDLSG